MTTGAQHILEQALKLSTKLRANCAHVLLRTLDGEPEVESDPGIADILCAVVDVYLRRRWKSKSPEPPAPRGVAEEILVDACQRPAPVRSALAEALILSLEDQPLETPAVVEAAWAEEIRRRVARVEAGEPCSSWEEVRTRILKTLNATTPPSLDA